MKPKLIFSLYQLKAAAKLLSDRLTPKLRQTMSFNPTPEGFEQSIFKSIYKLAANDSIDCLGTAGYFLMKWEEGEYMEIEIFITPASEPQ